MTGETEQERLDSELAAEALAMRRRAYAPYSHFWVGAAVRAASGRIYGGANVENASSGATTCAERNAIAAAVNAGERRLVAIAIAGGKEGAAESFCPPCGICRQVMREFASSAEFRIVFTKQSGELKVRTLAELLPESFGPDALA